MFPPSDNLLSTGDAAAHLNLSKSTLAKMRLSGVGPLYSKLGRRVVYRMADLNAWVVSHTHSSTSEYLQYGENAHD